MSSTTTAPGPMRTQLPLQAMRKVKRAAIPAIGGRDLPSQHHQARTSNWLRYISFGAVPTLQQSIEPVNEAPMQPRSANGRSVCACAGQQPAWPGGGYGYVWNIPQWYPHTSMALFAPAAGFHPLQYAGQQLPNFQQQPQQARFGYHCSFSCLITPSEWYSTA